MKKIEVEDNSYELIKEYKDGFDMDEFLKKCTDYFYGYEYILGDWAYGKLRLKGFCGKENKLLNNINDYQMIDKHIKNNCAFDCKYFILKKIK